jgi:octaprenyl-diphosphate synthase
MGLAFQLRDDALDYEAGAEQLGKPPYTDLGEGKVTLPLLLTLKRCTSTERAEIAAVLKEVASRTASLESGVGPPHEVDIEPVVRHVERYRGVVDTVRRARDHVARAAADIAPFPDSAARQALLAAADFAVARGS